MKGNFNADFDRFEKLTRKKMDKAYRAAALEVFTRITLLTPVGNPDLWKTPPSSSDYVGGRLRANWQFTIGQPASGEKDTTDYEGNEMAVAAKLGVPGIAIHNTLYFANNLPYAQAIEEGHSARQAPQGMVKITEVEFPQIVKRAARATSR